MEALQSFATTHAGARHAAKGAESSLMPYEDGAVFLSLSQSNATSAPVPLNLTTTLTASVLKDMKHWNVSVIRFNVPFYDVPLFTISNNSPMVVQLTDATGSASATVVNVPAITGAGNGGRIFELQVFAILVNSAIATAFAALPSKPVGAAAPVVAFDPVAGLFCVTAAATYYDYATATAPNLITFSINDELQTILTSFPFTVAASGACPFAFIIHDDGLNTTAGSVRVYQEGADLVNMLDVRGIQILTSLPISSSWAGVEATSGQPVLADYLIEDTTLGTFNTPLTYNAQFGPNRQVSLLGGGPLTGPVSCPVVFFNYDGTTGQLYLPPGGYANLLLMFRPKLTDPY